MALASRRAPRLSPLWLAVLGGAVFLTASTAAAARPGAAIRENTARRSALDLLASVDADTMSAFDYQRRRELSWPELSELAIVGLPGVPAGPVNLPPGAYEARVWFSGALTRQGTITVSASPRIVFGERTGTLANPAVVPFTLPIANGRVVIAVSDESAAAAVVRTEIVARALVPRRERLAGTVRAMESVPGWPNGYILYANAHAFPEGGVFWTRGLEAATVFVAPGGASRLRLTLHLGPNAGEVAVSAAGEERRVLVPRNDSATLDLSVPHGMRYVPVSVRSSAQFIPAEVDPDSADRRRLGVQVRVTLE
jgi:hypothetical protein